MVLRGVESEMTVIELINAALYSQSAFELAQRVFITGGVACAFLWLHWAFSKSQKYPWLGPLGAMAHTVLGLGCLMVIWTAPL